MLDDMENYLSSLTNLGNPGISFGIALLDIVLRVSMHATNIHQEVALLDNATTHTILRDFLFFNFFGNQTEAWQNLSNAHSSQKMEFQIP